MILVFLSCYGYSRGRRSILTRTLCLFAMPNSLRPLQQRLFPVYRYHAHKMWKVGKGLLFRLSDIPANILESMHTGNSCHLVPKPDTPEGRFIIDASNGVPLNGITAKEQAVLLQYGAVCLPNIRGVFSRWDDYCRRWNLQWSDLLIFKEDIKSCFNHLQWSTRSSKLLATMADPNVVFVMLMWLMKKMSLLPVRTSLDITLIVGF